MTATLEQAPVISPEEDLFSTEPVRISAEPITSLLNHHKRSLVKMMVSRDFKGRYRGSLLGALWPFIHPVGHLLLYTFVFCVVLKVRFGADGSTGNFALYLMSGLLPWGAISESIARSTTCILEQPNLVKRVVFPLEVIPIVVTLSSAATQIGGMLILMACAMFYQGGVHQSLLFLPVIAFSQLLFTTGLCWLLASLGVYVRDMRHLISLGLSVWMYMTPIVYPASALPEKLKFLVWINPVAGIVTDYRRVILEGNPPDFAMYAFYTTISVLFFFSGYYFFMKTKRSFADVM